jgi:hypothetical protein
MNFCSGRREDVQVAEDAREEGGGTRSRRRLEGGGQDGACGREPLLDRMSWSWSRGSRCGAITPVRSPRGTRCRRRAAWKEGNKGYPSDQIHCGGGARSGTRRGCGKTVASEDFASFRIYVFVRSSFSPLVFFLSSAALPGICVHFQILSITEWVLSNMRCCSGGVFR